LLNRLEGVYVREELLGMNNFESRKVVEISSGGMTAYVLESLQHPMLVWPDGEDLTQRNKTTVIVGSTFNP